MRLVPAGGGGQALRIFVSGDRSQVGKSTVCLGLLGALLARGIERMRKGFAIKDVCAGEGLSPYVFRKLFVANVGMTPKRYLRIARFRDALGCLTPASSLSDLAFDADFADQSHMTREIEQFAAMTPGRLRASDRPYAGHVREPFA